jgi:VanZ family protein
MFFEGNAHFLLKLGHIPADLLHTMKWEILIGLEQRKHNRLITKYFALRGFILLLVSVFLFLGFSQTIANHSFWNQNDKLIHFSVFSFITLGLVLFLGNKCFARLHGLSLVFLVVFSMSVLGVLTELSHALLPYRTFELKDILANLTGIFAVAIPVLLMNPFSREKDSVTALVFQSLRQRYESNCWQKRYLKGH